jgi:hypothetical protein
MSRLLHAFPHAPKFAAALGLFVSLFASQPASAATTEVYYQREFSLTCSVNFCNVTLPKVAAGQKLFIRNITCALGTGIGGSAQVGILFFTYAGKEQPFQYLLPYNIPNAGVSYFIKDLDVLILPTKTARITVGATTKALYANCTVLGRIEKPA